MSRRYYVYGIAGAAPDRPITSAPVGTVAGPVEVLAIGGVHVVLSATEDAEILPVRRNTIGHTRVLEELMMQGVTVLPMRFGVLVESLASIERAIAASRTPLLALLASLEGKMEVGITVRFNREALFQEIAAERPQIGARGRSLRGGDEVATYHDRVALGQEVERMIRAKNEAHRRELLARIAPFCRDKKELAAPDDMTVVRAACLVDAAAEPDLWSVVQDFSKARALRCDIAYLAPVPPYNFVSANLDWGSPAEPGR